MDLTSATIKEIDESMVGDFVSVGGAVSSPRESNGNIFFDLQQGSYTIKTVVFKADNDGLELKHGQEVTVEGEVAMYKGSLELIAHEVKLSS